MKSSRTNTARVRKEAQTPRQPLKTSERSYLLEFLERGCFKTWGEVKETAAANKTLCDFDGSLPADLRARVRAIRRLTGARPVRIRLDRTVRGYHLVIHWDRAWTPFETVALQAILGSDPMREALNFARALARPDPGEFWNILYSRKHDV